MSITVHQRPGVYSSYDASSLVSGSGGGRVVGLAVVNGRAEAGKVYTFTGYESAAVLFGTEGEGAKLVGLALKNGASAVVAAVAAGEEDYESAFAALSGVEDISVVICGSTAIEVQQMMRDSVLEASAARRERIAVAAGEENEEVSALIARAAALNCERVVLAAPGGLDCAAALAGAIAGEKDPAVPMGGAQLTGLQGLSARYTDGELDLLLLGGVTPLESVGGRVSVVRAVTTRTTTGGEPDATWRELTTIRVVDDVIPTLRSSLRAKFRRAKNTPRGRSAIRAQVVLVLKDKATTEINTGYEKVAVTADSEDPTRCLVDFSFTVAHGLNQIWLTAHITV